MINIITEAIIDGYPANDTNFELALFNAPPESSSAFETQILSPINEVLASPDQTAVLTITGHADRVDTDGLTREQRRQQELDASAARSANADHGVKFIIANQRGFPPDSSPEQLEQFIGELKQLVIVSRAAGAAVLVQGGDSLTEEQRRQNRRVQFRVIRFVPS